MKQVLFKPGTLYFICENCGKMCVAREPNVCDRCEEYYTGHNFLTYSGTDDDEQAYVPKAHIVQPIPVQPERRPDAEPIQNNLDEMPLPRPIRLEQPVFEYSVCIFEEGKRVDVRDGKRIKLGDNVEVMGRTSLLSDSRLLDNGLSMDERFNGISRENVVLIQTDGKLFVQYRNDGIRKSKIRVNGIVLEQGKRIQLEEGDEIRFGPVRYPEKCIDVQIYRIHYAQTEEEVHEEIRQIKESVNWMQTQMTEMDGKLESFLANINPEALKWKEDDSEESYGKRLDAILPREGPEGETAQIRQFFLLDTKEGQKDCSGNYSFMWEEDQQLRHFLYIAAFYEKVCSSLFDETEHEDYYPVCGNIGKAVELFVRDEMAALIDRYLKKEFDEYTAETNSGTKFIAQAKYLAFLNGKGKKREEIIKQMFASLGIPNKEWERRLREWRRAIDEIFKIVELRNKNAHPQCVRREEYMEFKKFMLNSRAVWMIHQYYLLMVGKR